MSSYAFVLGNTPELSLLEIESVLAREDIRFTKKQLSKEMLKIESSKNLDSKRLIDTLGGTVKIAKFCTSTKNLDYKLASYLDKTDNKISFGLSIYGNSINIKWLANQLKNHLKKQGISVRFVLPKDSTLSSVVIKKQELQELILVKEKENFLVFKTEAVQNFEGWNFRDYQRPCVDPKHGMLPPKVARMMVNLGEGKVLLDPFCGVGTILSEGLLMDCNVIGIDQSEKAISFSKENLNWLSKNYKFNQTYELFCHDATHVSQKLKLESVDCIVTEPFMGPCKKLTSKETIGNIIKGLEKLYIGCLKDWNKVLKQDGKIVMAIPSIKFENLEFRVKSPIDNMRKLGYTFCLGPITYSRPQAVVKRNIYIFEKS